LIRKIVLGGERTCHFVHTYGQWRVGKGPYKISVNESYFTKWYDYVMVETMDSIHIPK